MCVDKDCFKCNLGKNLECGARGRYRPTSKILAQTQQKLVSFLTDQRAVNLIKVLRLFGQFSSQYDSGVVIYTRRAFIR